jgi:hypothetical protein
MINQQTPCFSSTLTVWAFTFLASMSLSARDWHVSPEGAAAAAGTAEAPTQDLAKVFKEVQPGDRVIIHGGTWRGEYELARSGTAEQPIIIEAAPGTQPEFTALQIITPGANGYGSWEKLSDTLWRISFPQNWSYGVEQSYTQQLYCQRELWSIARWPNSAEVIGYERDHFGIADSGQTMQDLPKEGNMNQSIGRYYATGLNAYADNALIGGYVRCVPGMGWWHSNGQITASTSGSVDFKYGRFMGGRIDTTFAGDPFFVYGRLALLDGPKEFFFDGQGLDGPARTLYVHVPSGQTPDKQEWEFRAQKQTLTLSERAHLQFRHLHFRGGAIGGWKESNFLKFSHCVVKHGGWSYDVGQGAQHSVNIVGQGSVLEHCQIEGATTHGIRLMGKNHTVQNCVITECGNQAISIEGEGHIIEHNSFGYVGSHGINMAPGAQVRHNHIFYTGQAITDVASINIWNGGDMLNAEAKYNWAYLCDPPLEHSKHWNGGCGVRVDNGGAPQGVFNLHYHHNVVWGNSAKNDIMGWDLLENQQNFGNMNWTARHNTVERDVIILKNGGSYGGSFVENNVADRLNLYNADPTGITAGGNVWAIQPRQNDLFAKATFQAPQLRDFRLAADSPALNAAIAIGKEPKPAAAGAYQPTENWLPGAQVDLSTLDQATASLTRTLSGHDHLTVNLPPARFLTPETEVIIGGQATTEWRQLFDPKTLRTQLSLVRPAGEASSVTVTIKDARNKAEITATRTTADSIKTTAYRLNLPSLTMQSLRGETIRLRLTAEQHQTIGSTFSITTEDGQDSLVAELESTGSSGATYLLRQRQDQQLVVWSKSTPPAYYLVTGGLDAARVAGETLHPALTRAGLRVWLRADDLATGPLSIWPNRAPQHQHPIGAHSATQENKDARPQIVTDGFGGRPTVRFDGDNDFFQLGPPEGLGVGSFEVYIMWSSPNPGEAQHQRWCRLLDVKIPKKYKALAEAAEASKANDKSKMSNQMSFEEKHMMMGKNKPEPMLVQPLPFQFENNDPARKGCIPPSPGAQMYGKNFLGSTDRPYLMSQMRLGGTLLDDGRPHHFFKGDISEVLIFDRQLTNAERDQVYDYLNKRYYPLPAEKEATLGPKS